MNNILIVDDMEMYRKLMREFLGLLEVPVNVFDTYDGRHAERLIVEHDIDTLITDIVMEEREGLETIAAVRRKFPHVRIMAVSGGGIADAHAYLNMAIKLGASCALKKPFRKNEFLKVVREELLMAPSHLE